MPDIRQYAQESLASELSVEPVFAAPAAPPPLEDEVIETPVSPLPELPTESAEASLELPERPGATEFQLPLGQTFASQPPELPLPSRSMSASETFGMPDRPVAREFDLPLGNLFPNELGPLPMPRPGQRPQPNLQTGRPESPPDVPLSTMMREQRQYSEMSLRDFMEEQEWEELPMPFPSQRDSEPFPLPQRNQSPEARLDTPFVPPPPRPTETVAPPDRAERTAGPFETPFESQADVRVTLQSVREEIARDRQLYSLGQE